MSVQILEAYDVSKGAYKSSSKSNNGMVKFLLSDNGRTISAIEHQSILPKNVDLKALQGCSISWQPEKIKIFNNIYYLTPQNSRISYNPKMALNTPGGVVEKMKEYDKKGLFYDTNIGSNLQPPPFVPFGNASGLQSTHMFSNNIPSDAIPRVKEESNTKPYYNDASKTRGDFGLGPKRPNLNKPYTNKSNTNVMNTANGPFPSFPPVKNAATKFDYSKASNAGNSITSRISNINNYNRPNFAVQNPSFSRLPMSKTAGGLPNLMNNLTNFPPPSSFPGSNPAHPSTFFPPAPFMTNSNGISSYSHMNAYSGAPPPFQFNAKLQQQPPMPFSPPRFPPAGGPPPVNISNLNSYLFPQRRR